jgi:hypothetical protein
MISSRRLLREGLEFSLFKAESVLRKILTSRDTYGCQCVPGEVACFCSVLKLVVGLSVLGFLQGRRSSSRVTWYARGLRSWMRSSTESEDVQIHGRDDISWAIKTCLLALLCSHAQLLYNSKQTRLSPDSLRRPMLGPYPAICTFFNQDFEKQSQPVFLKTRVLRTSFTDRSLGCWLGDVSTWSMRFWATCAGWNSSWHAAVDVRKDAHNCSSYQNGTPDCPWSGRPNNATSNAAVQILRLISSKTSPSL